MWSTRCEGFSPDAFCSSKSYSTWRTLKNSSNCGCFEDQCVISTGTFPIFFRRRCKGGITGSASIGVFSHEINFIISLSSTVFLWAAIRSLHCDNCRSSWMRLALASTHLGSSADGHDDNFDDISIPKKHMYVCFPEEKTVLYMYILYIHIIYVYM